MSPAGQSSKQSYQNNGDSDVSTEGIPSQFLLLRGLEPGVTEELFAKGVEKLYRASSSSQSSNTSKKPAPKVSSTTSDSNLGARNGTLQRVMIVRDRRTGESW